MTEAPRRRWPSFLARLSFELVIVFVGVYAAFALSEYQADREAEERRRQLEIAIVREIEDITNNTRQAIDLFGQLLAPHDQPGAAADRPLPTPFLEPLGVENHMWEAMLRSGGIELFEIPTIYRLSQFYNELNEGFARLEQLRLLSESQLIPNLDRGPTEFYDADGRLRARYQWYPASLRSLVAIAERLTSMGDALVADLGGSDFDN